MSPSSTEHAWTRDLATDPRKKHASSVQDEFQNEGLSGALLESRNEETNIAGGALGGTGARRDGAGDEVGF